MSLDRAKPSVVNVVSMRMRTVRVSELREQLAGRTDDRAKRVLQSVEGLGPRFKVTVREEDLQAPKAAPAEKPVHAGPALGTVDPPAPPTAEEPASPDGNRPKAKK